MVTSWKPLTSKWSAKRCDAVSLPPYLLGEIAWSHPMSSVKTGCGWQSVIYRRHKCKTVGRVCYLKLFIPWAYLITVLHCTRTFGDLWNVIHRGCNRQSPISCRYHVDWLTLLCLKYKVRFSALNPGLHFICWWLYFSKRINTSGWLLRMICWIYSPSPT